MWAGWRLMGGWAGFAMAAAGRDGMEKARRGVSRRAWLAGREELAGAGAVQAMRPPSMVMVWPVM